MTEDNPTAVDPQPALEAVSAKEEPEIPKEPSSPKEAEIAPPAPALAPPVTKEAATKPASKAKPSNASADVSKFKEGNRVLAPQAGLLYEAKVCPTRLFSRDVSHPAAYASLWHVSQVLRAEQRKKGEWVYFVHYQGWNKKCASRLSTQAPLHPGALHLAPLHPGALCVCPVPRRRRRRRRRQGLCLITSS